MLLEIINNQLMKDGESLAKDMKVNVDSQERLLRVKFKFNIKEKEEEIDLAVAYYLPDIGLSGVSVKIEGRELKRKIDFILYLVKEFRSNSWKVRGDVGKKKVNQEVGNFVELLEIIKRNI